MNYKKILVTDATGVVGAAINAVKDGYPRSRFILICSQDCDLNTEVVPKIRTMC